MSGTRWLLISRENKIYKIPQPQNWVHKPVLELAEQEVLEVILFYTLKDRKPSELLMVAFDRILLDGEGRRIKTEGDERRAFHNFFEFGLTSVEELAARDVRSIPVAPILPSTLEKEALYAYLREKLAILADQAPIVVEYQIETLKRKHEEYLTMIKVASKLKRQHK